MGRGLRGWLCLGALALGLALGSATLAHADAAALEVRLGSLSADASDPERDLLGQARAALDEAARRRSAGDEAGAERAERIAAAALDLVETRRRLEAARRAVDEARARREALDARARTARDARDAAERERDRLGGTMP